MFLSQVLGRRLHSVVLKQVLFFEIELQRCTNCCFLV